MHREAIQISTFAPNSCAQAPTLAIPVWPFHGECVRQVADFADSAPFEEDLDDIEADFDRRAAEQAEVTEAGAGEAASAFGIDGVRGAGPFLGGAGFDLDEDEAVMLAENKINLTTTRAEIGGQEFEALAFEVFSGRPFAELAVEQMQWLGGTEPSAEDAFEKCHRVNHFPNSVWPGF